MDIAATTAAQGYSELRRAARPDPAGTEARPAAAALARDFAATLREGEETAIAAMTAVTVRDRVVEAYQEILRMPV